MTEMIILCTTTAFSIWKVLRSIIRASYRLYLNKKKIRLQSVYHVFANGIGKVPGVKGFPIHDQVFGKGIATYGQIIFTAPLAVLYFLSQFYTLVKVLASLRALPSGCLQTVQGISVATLAGC